MPYWFKPTFPIVQSIQNEQEWPASLSILEMFLNYISNHIGH